MKIRVLVLIFSLAASISAGCNPQSNKTNNGSQPTPSSTAAPDALAEAIGIYARDCEKCHGAEGKGGRVKLDDGSRLRVPSLREGHALRHPNSEFVKQITQGGDGMPAYKDKLNEAQINDLISYIRREFQPGITPPPEKPGKTH